MEKRHQTSPAEIADRHRRFMALAMLALSFMFLSKALMHLLPEDMAISSDYFQIAAAIITVILVAPITLWKMKHRSSSERLVYFSKDGYAAQALFFAQKMSWAVTFILLICLESLNSVLSRYPTEFALQLLLAVMLASMSLIFLFKTRNNDGLEFGGGATSHA